MENASDNPAPSVQPFGLTAADIGRVKLWQVTLVVIAMMVVMFAAVFSASQLSLIYLAKIEDIWAKELALIVGVIGLGFGLSWLGLGFIANMCTGQRGAFFGIFAPILAWDRRPQIGLFVFVYLAYFVIAGLAIWLSDPASLKKITDTFSLIAPAQAAILICAAVPVFIIQSGFEEAFFRGFLPKSLAGTGLAPIWAIIIANIFFMSAHLSGQSAPIYLAAIFFMGVAFAYISWRTGGLEVSWALHSANNLLVGVLANGLFDGSGFSVSGQEASGLPIYFLGLIGLVEGLRLFWPGLKARAPLGWADVLAPVRSDARPVARP